MPSRAEAARALGRTRPSCRVRHTGRRDRSSVLGGRYQRRRAGSGWPPSATTARYHTWSPEPEYGHPARTRRAAVMALPGSLGADRKCRETLEDLLDDRDTMLRLDVARALTELSDAKARPALRERLEVELDPRGPEAIVREALRDARARGQARARVASVTKSTSSRPRTPSSAVASRRWRRAYRTAEGPGALPPRSSRKQGSPRPSEDDEHGRVPSLRRAERHGGDLDHRASPSDEQSIAGSPLGFRAIGGGGGAQRLGSGCDHYRCRGQGVLRRCGSQRAARHERRRGPRPALSLSLRAAPSSTAAPSPWLRPSMASRSVGGWSWRSLEICASLQAMPSSGSPRRPWESSPEGEVRSDSRASAARLGPKSSSCWRADCRQPMHSRGGS